MTEPTPINVQDTPCGCTHLQWLAGLAMQALIGRTTGIPDSLEEREEIALWAYRMAQAMQATETRLNI